MSSTKRSSGYSIHGVRLKHFEQVLTKVLPSISPTYVQLPPVPQSSNNSNNNNNNGTSTSSSIPWPFDRLPDTARVEGDRPGQLSQPHRARRKEQQLQSMIRCILRLIPTSSSLSSHTTTTTTTTTIDDDLSFHIVDFGGGSGHLAIPLALLLPQCTVVVVDLNHQSLMLLHQKAELVVQQQLLKLPSVEAQYPIITTKSFRYPKDDPRFHCCGRNGILENLFSFDGPVEDYMESFDMAVALHLCGQATDVALRKAISVGASSLVVAPCCVGKLSRQVLNPDIYHATGQNIPTVSYPQSSIACQLIQDPADWDALAKAADYSNEHESRTARNATRRTAKAVLETDRCLFLQRFAYRTALMRMDPWEATPKNDIIVAWDPTKVTLPDDDTSCFVIPDPEAQADLQVVTNQLLRLEVLDPSGATDRPMDRSDWTHDEEVEIESQISIFLNQTERLPDKMDQVLVFPTRMGGRKRKLIHFVANKFDLAHWSMGDKDSEKTVAVARRGQNKKR